MSRAVPLLAGALLAAAGCVTNASAPSMPPDLPGYTPGSPGLGAHALTFHRYYVATNPPAIETDAMHTASVGSTIVVGVGRGNLGAHAPPSDNKGNAPYEQLGDPHAYTNWPSSGTALYSFTSMTGGADHVIRAATPPEDEIGRAHV